MATEDLTITLRTDLAAMIRERVASGEYASASEVVEDGLDALAENDPFAGPVFDAWVRDRLRPSIAAYEADPSRAIPLDEVRRDLDDLYAQHRSGR